MKKLKVLQVGLSYKAGGIESFLLSYQKYLNTDKIQMDFINVFKEAVNEEFYMQLEKKGKIHNLSNYRKHPIKFLKELKIIQENEQYDVFHYNMNSACYLAPLIIAKLLGFKIIISHSHNSSSDKGIMKNVVHNINKHLIPLFANRYFACSKKAGKWFFSKKILSSNKFFVIKNAIDTEKFKFNYKLRNEKRKSLNISSNTIVIGNVARFKKQKNHEFLINIFEEYHKLNKNSILMLIGFGPLEEYIKNIVKNKKIDDSVLFLGERNDVNELMNAIDIFVLPSLYEGLPIVGVEAQISGAECFFSTSITEELKIIESTKFISLNKVPRKWAKEILNTKVDLEARANINIDSFDIRKNAENLEKIYMSMYLN